MQSQTVPSPVVGAPSLRPPGRLARASGWSMIILALIVTYICFGSSPAGTKAALASFPPLLIMAARGCLAGVVLTIWALCTGARRPNLPQLVLAFMVGMLILALGVGVGVGVGTVGQRTVASSVVGVLSAMMPLIAACLGFLLFREKPARRALAGLVIGFAGIGLLRPESDLDMFGVTLLIVAQIAWALGAVLAPRLRLPEDPRLAAGLELLGGTVVLLVAALPLNAFSGLNLQAASRSSWFGLGWLVFTAIGGFTAYGYLAKRVSTSISTTFSYVNPIVAVGLGAFLFGEPLTARMMFTTVVVVVGVFLIVSSGGPDKPDRRVHHPITSGHGHVRRVSPAAK